MRTQSSRSVRRPKVHENYSGIGYIRRNSVSELISVALDIFRGVSFFFFFLYTYVHFSLLLLSVKCIILMKVTVINYLKNDERKKEKIHNALHYEWEILFFSDKSAVTGSLHAN